MISDDIKVTILGVKGGQVRIGIRAPKTTPVHRQEIYDRIQKELNHTASKLSNQEEQV